MPRPLRLLPALAAFLIAPAALSTLTAPAEAQSLAAENSATIEIDTELAVAGDLSASSGGSVSFGSGAALTLSGSAQQSLATPVTVADLTLDNPNGASLTAAVDVTGTLTLTGGTLTTGGNLTLRSTGESSSARIAGSGSGSISGDVTAERFLDRKDGSADDSHWRFLASPVEAALDAEPGGGGGEHDTFDGPPLLSNTWTQGDGMTGANTQVSGAVSSARYYDETADVGSDFQVGWKAVGDLTDPPAGPNVEDQEGFAVFLFEDRDFDGTGEGFPLTLSATGTAADVNTGNDIGLPVTCTDNDGGDPGNDGCTDAEDGWNLVANPFLSHVDWTSSSVTDQQLEQVAYIWDSDSGQFQLTDGTNGGDEFIAPFQAIFVKSNAPDGSEAGASLSVSSAAKADPTGSDAEFKSTDGEPAGSESANSEPVVSLQLVGEEQAEEARITYREAAEAGKDRFDGYQLTPFSGDYHFLASEIEGREALFASQYRPPPAGQDTLDLAIEATKSGSFTLEADTLRDLPPEWNVILENTGTGARWDLGAGESVTFEHAPPGTDAPLSTDASSHPSGNPSGDPSGDPSGNPSATGPGAALAEGPPVARADAQAAAQGAAQSAGSGAPDFRLYVGPDAALPVELTGFEATSTEEGVRLTWETASETRNAGFAVERRVASSGTSSGESSPGESSSGSSSGTEWTKVGFVDGAGTTTQAQRYRFEDSELPFEVETATYRLRQQDLDGTETLSGEVTVQIGGPSEAKLHAPFPNPASREATLRYEVPESTGAKILLYNTLGQQVRTVATSPAGAGRAEKTLDVSGLPSGTYFLRMEAGPTTETRRISVVR